MTEYGSRIKKYRDARGYSQDFMAEQLGISQNAFHKIETGQTKIRAQTLQQIADILEVYILRLLQEDQYHYKIKQTSHDNSHATGVAIYSDSFEQERKGWQAVEQSLRESLEAQKVVIASLLETINAQKELIAKFSEKGN